MTENLLNMIKKEDLIELASDFVRFKTFKEEETPLAEHLASWFGDRGYDVYLDEVEKGRFQTIATLRGKGGGKSLMFNAHLDINSMTRGWDRDPWQSWVEGDKLFGHGVQNMKGGLASMIVAADAFRKADIHLKGDIVLACVVGETQGGEGTHHLMERGFRTDAAILTEPYGRGNLCTKHSGILHFALHVRGKSRHLSTPEGAIHAIRKMATIVEHLDSLRFSAQPDPSLPGLPRHNVGSIIGGRGDTYILYDAPYIPDMCTIIVDVHFLPSQTVPEIIADFEAHLQTLKDEDSELNIEIEVPPPAFFKGRRRLVMPPADVPVDSEIVQLVAENFTKISGLPVGTIGAVLPAAYSACDSSWLWKAGIPCLNYGPSTGGLAMSGPEGAYVVISEMEEVAKVLALTALDFCEAA
jgi:acetylornithine deacetylase